MDGAAMSDDRVAGPCRPSGAPIWEIRARLHAWARCWKRGRQWSRQSAGEEPRRPRYQAVELWTAERRVRGWVEGGIDGLIEQLQGTDIRLANGAQFDLRAVPRRHGEPPDLPAWTLLPTAPILIAVPDGSDRASIPAGHHRQLAVIVHVDRFIVCGTAHLRAGATFDPSVLALRQPFLPLTRATLRHLLFPEIYEHAATVVVNLARVRYFRAG